MKTSKSSKIKYCGACINNIYNMGGLDGSTKECWSLANAEVVWKKHKEYVEHNSCINFDNFKNSA